MFKVKKVTVPLQITIFHSSYILYITELVFMQKPLKKLCLMLQSTCTLNGAQYEPLIIYPIYRNYTFILHVLSIPLTVVW